MRPVLAGARPSAVATGLTAEFDPDAGMLGTSLRLRGEELLGPLGIPFLHPWANRLADGRPIHGTPPRPFTVEAQGTGVLVASLDYEAHEQFPFPHRVTHVARTRTNTLRVDTALTPTSGIPVPVSFGFHPYFRLRRDEVVALPARERLVADELCLPTGARMEEPAEIFPLADRTFDDGYHVGERARFVAGRIAVTFLFGYPYAQVYAPRDSDFICIEPMTAPTNALVSGDGLRHVVPGGTFRAAFEIRVG